MRTLRTAPVIATLALAAALIIPTAATAATPNAVLKSQLRVQKAKVAKLKRDLSETKKDLSWYTGQVTTLMDKNSTLTTQNSTLTTQNLQISTLGTQNATLSTTNATLTTQNAALSAQVSAQAAGGLSAVLAGSPTDLWNAIVAIYPLMPNSSGLCGFNTSAFFGSSLTSYTFDRWAAC
jgi:hypothetical protein